MKNHELKETPHIKPNGVEIAETILLPGDPLRAKFIAENFLENPVLLMKFEECWGTQANIKERKFLLWVPVWGLQPWRSIHGN